MTRTFQPGCLGAFLVAALFLLFAPATIAQDAHLRGDPAVYREEGERLFEFLAAVRTETEARAMEREIWLHWFRAPDVEAGSLMAEAIDRRRAYDLAGAVAILDRLVGYAPDWAEGWNQRATIRFMQGDYPGSLMDIEETLKREPRHFGALAGMAIILTRQGRVRQAQTVLKHAVTIHPFLKERGMIVQVPEEEL